MDGQLVCSERVRIHEPQRYLCTMGDKIYVVHLCGSSQQKWKMPRLSQKRIKVTETKSTLKFWQQESSSCLVDCQFGFKKVVTKDNFQKKITK